MSKKIEFSALRYERFFHFSIFDKYTHYVFFYLYEIVHDF